MMMGIRVRSAALFLLIFLSCLLLTAGGLASDMAPEPVPLPVWRGEVLAPGVNFYALGAPSLALDPDGYPHIVFGANHLFHTWFDGAAWQRETVDATHAVGRESVLAIDAAGTINVAELRNRQIFLHTLAPGGSWQMSRIPMPGSWDLSLALDGDGWLHIVSGPSYYENVAAFHYARQTPIGWAVSDIETGSAVDGPFAIALDGDNQPAILYEQHDSAQGTEELWIARRSDGVWQQKRVAPGCIIVGKSLALDAQERAHVVFSEHCDSKLTYAREVGNGWELSLAADDGVHPSLALDKAGDPHLVYGADAGQIYAVRKDKSWEKTIVQPGNYAGWYNTLILDEDGAAHIASVKSALHYTTNESGIWAVSTPAVKETVGRRSALALNAFDVPHTLYHEAEVEELYWGSGSAGNWEAELIAQVSAADLELAIAVDTLDRPHIAYVDGDRDQLVAGLRQANQWSLETIAAGGERLSIAAGSENRPHLIIVQGGELVYWTKEDDAWVNEIVVKGADLYPGIWRAWLALDSENRPHIAYSVKNGSIHTYRQADGQWVAEALPFETIDGLSFGPGDKLYLLHSETTWTNPKYPFLYVDLSFAERDVTGWQSTSIWGEEYLDWEDPYWDGQAHLAVDAQQRVHVAVGGAEGFWYDYMQRDESGAWFSESLTWAYDGDIDLALGQDGEPRLLLHDGSSLILSTREYLWLDNFSLMPITAR